MEESGAEYMEVDEESSLLLCEGNEADNLDFEGDFEQTLTMLDMGVEEVMIEVQNSHEEVS